MGTLSRTFDAARNYVGSITWEPLVNVSRAAVFRIFRSIEVGQMAIVDVDGVLARFGAEPGSENSEPSLSLKIKKEAFWVRLLLFADMVQSYTWQGA